MTGPHHPRVIACVAALLLAAAPALPELPPVLGAESFEYTHVKDTLLDVAARSDVGIIPLMALNPDVDVWIPPANTRVRLPTDYVLPETPHDGLVINVPEMRLYDYTRSKDAPTVLPVAVGDITDQTPVAEFRVGQKRIDPVWTVPESIRTERPDLPAVVPAGPDNPLGDRWLTLGTSSYGIHGTNNLWSIGREATHGCVRLYNADMRALYDRIKSGTKVRIIYQRVKLGQRDGLLFLEAHQDPYDRDPDPLPAVLARLIALEVTGVIDGRALDEPTVRRIVTEARGVPVQVGRLASPPQD